MPQPAALTARMSTNMAASRPCSRNDSSVRILRQREARTGDLGTADLSPGPVTDRTALRPRTRVRRRPARRPDSSPGGASPLRDSAGFTPDFAGRAAARAGPGQPAKLPYWLITRLTRPTWRPAAGAVSGQLAARQPPDICHTQVVDPGTAGS